MKIREKYLKKFKKSNLQIDYNFYIEAKYNTQKLIKQKKIKFCNTKLTKNIGKLKELSKSLKNLVSVKNPLANICLRTKDDITNSDDKKNAHIFYKNFCILAHDLPANLPSPLWRFGLNFVRKY